MESLMKRLKTFFATSKPMDPYQDKEFLDSIGTLFGEAKKLDSNVVGASKNLSPDVGKPLYDLFQQVVTSNIPRPAEPQNAGASPSMLNNFQHTVNPPMPPPDIPLPEQKLVNAPYVGDQSVLIDMSKKLDRIIELLESKKNGIKPRKRKPRKVSIES